MVQKCLVKSWRHNEPQHVRAMPCGVPGLAITPALDVPGWTITHLRSGLAVAWFKDADPEAVLAAALALADLADWTVCAEDIAAEVSLAEVQQACNRWGGSWYITPPIPHRYSDLPEM